MQFDEYVAAMFGAGARWRAVPDVCALAAGEMTGRRG
jgi:hypothetical protein